jgi:hypothetical protein
VDEELRRREAVVRGVVATLDEVVDAVVLKAVLESDRSPVEAEERKAEETTRRRPARDLRVELLRVSARDDRCLALPLPA